MTDSQEGVDDDNDDEDDDTSVVPRLRFVFLCTATSHRCVLSGDDHGSQHVGQIHESIGADGRMLGVSC